MIFNFWGKAEKGGNAFHPAVFHMIDVGIVARVLVSTLPLRLQERLLSIFDPLGDNCLAFFIALHDIGKISPGFQLQREDLCAILKEQGFEFPIGSEKSHCTIASSCLSDILINELNCPAEPAHILSAVLAAHHGTFISSDSASAGKKQWEKARRDVVHYLSEIFHIKTLESVSLSSTADALILSGLLTAADWIGSSEAHFPYSGGAQLDIQEYIADRTERAKSLIHELGMDSVAFNDKIFGDLFTFSPNPCQEAVLEVVSQLSHPMLMIVESPMGSGKTEAAQAAFSCIASHNNLRGMYYALPTQATGNAMFKRMIPFLKKLNLSEKAELHLLHANADLNPDYDGLKVRSIDEGSKEGSVVASSWFTARKKGILASYATGTIDQALMAALKVRHFFLRLFGLMGKVVVLDEVHAYDAYMTEEIGRLIGWLAHCESSVILLSATLPKTRRRQLLQAFSPSAITPDDLKYPCVLGVDTDGKVVWRNIEYAASTELTLEPIVVTQEDKAAKIVRLLKEKLADGGCAACILNTVTEAQTVYDEAKKEIGDAQDITLFHSRFSKAWKIDLEEHIICLYGKEGNRPWKGIIVATQVIEQSLDLDFDLMISDLAPIDLLFQRAGRLQRHDNQRSSLLKDRILYVLMPDIRGGDTNFGWSKLFYFPDILLRTAALFTDQNKYQSIPVSLPHGISSLIEKVYGDDDILISERLQDKLEKWNEERLGKEYANRYAALLAAIRSAWLCIDEPDYLLRISNEYDDEKMISTRIARPSVTLIPTCEGDDLNARTKEDVKKFYSRSITTDNAFLVSNFLEQEPPAEWKDRPLLRHCRAFTIKDGRATIGNRIVLYDDEYGLQIIKKPR